MCVQRGIAEGVEFVDEPAEEKEAVRAMFFEGSASPSCHAP
jgi:hypothetical protein